MAWDNNDHYSVMYYNLNSKFNAKFEMFIVLL